jgi:uncharacterized protein YbjT (DUF2867 family)
MILILGASGTVGSRVARRLLGRGESVRVVSRDRTRLADLASLGAQPVRGDLRTGDWMPAALDGVKSIVLSTHGLVPPTRDNHPGIVDDEGNRRMIDAAVKAGVEHVVFLSVTANDSAPILFAQAKQRTEQYLRSATSLTHTIVRPTVYIETHGLMLMGEPLRAKGSVQFFGGGTTTLNWISADDVTDHVVDALNNSALRNRTTLIGGPDNFSRLEVLAIIEQALGRTARRQHLPVGVLRGMKLIVGSFHPA